METENSRGPPKDKVVEVLRFGPEVRQERREPENSPTGPPGREEGRVDGEWGRTGWDEGERKVCGTTEEL